MKYSTNHLSTESGGRKIPLYENMLLRQQNLQWKYLPILKLIINFKATCWKEYQKFDSIFPIVVKLDNEKLQKELGKI
jgi:hypothetical protein